MGFLAVNIMLAFLAACALWMATRPMVDARTLAARMMSNSQ